MPTPSEPRQPHDDRPPLEPVRVVRPRRTDALAELLKDLPPRTGGYETLPVPAPQPGSEDSTQELPPVRADEAHSATGPGRRGVGRRRAAVAVAVAAAAVVGFGCAFLLPDRNDRSDADTAAPTPDAPPTSAAPPTPGGGAAVDPDGAGTLREGASGPEVTDLQERLLRIPNVYQDGSTSGQYDAGLTEAVARFQLWYGIRGDETGVYGDDTRRDLESRTGTG
ncbi:peptidoglycan-binding domain-containing protein [Streptomyces sp. DG2A-72]|uniref:peptidoglycan-binding domain-containing protein n=1 Tax=Streptomyces sp. DG2A-72 TaxID=3051386 RepID=UPI00265BF894|nr:peptidoglycan-binding domain-containing protein [Streptomyces sp. DG2A-72]MDO0938781.1 peptidoglycan-binding domain-containing protein [Streptomyces sp. DG2A-72]